MYKTKRGLQVHKLIGREHGEKSTQWQSQFSYEKRKDHIQVAIKSIDDRANVYRNYQWD